MSTPTITWRCGCRTEARDVGEGIETHPVDWELHYCPLHAAAGELRDALVGLCHIDSICWCKHNPGATFPNHAKACKAAYAVLNKLGVIVHGAEPKPKAKEAGR